MNTEQTLEQYGIVRVADGGAKDDVAQFRVDRFDITLGEFGRVGNGGRVFRVKRQRDDRRTQLSICFGLTVLGMPAESSELVSREDSDKFFQCPFAGFITFDELLQLADSD